MHPLRAETLQQTSQLREELRVHSNNTRKYLFWLEMFPPVKPILSLLDCTSHPDIRDTSRDRPTSATLSWTMSTSSTNCQLSERNLLSRRTTSTQASLVVSQTRMGCSTNKLQMVSWDLG